MLISIFFLPPAIWFPAKLHWNLDDEMHSKSCGYRVLRTLRLCFRGWKTAEASNGRRADYENCDMRETGLVVVHTLLTPTGPFDLQFPSTFPQRLALQHVPGVPTVYLR